MIGSYFQIVDILKVHVSSSKWGLSLYSIPLAQISKRIISGNGLNEHLPDIMSGIGNPTKDASIGLSRLACLLGRYPDHLGILGENSHGIEWYLERLERSREGKQGVEYFRNLLRMYGHRRLGRDILQPSWKEDPMIPFSTVRQIAMGTEGWTSFDAIDEERKGWKKAKKSILSSLGPFERNVAGFIFDNLRRYLHFREEQRYYLDMIFSEMRLLFLEIGERMVQRRSIHERDDIFFLEAGTILNSLSERREVDLSDEAIFNRITMEDVVTTPGRFLRGGVNFDDRQSDEDVASEQNKDELVNGQPISNGNMTGTVVVLKGQKTQKKIDSESVLVMDHVDPGQTHLFLLAGGLILEVSGLLSHGAILAREMGIPTVANVKNATSMFSDGQRVEINGTEGWIKLIERKAGL